MIQINSRTDKTLVNENLKVGMRIASEDPNKKIEVAPNTKGGDDYIARIRYNKRRDQWFACDPYDEEAMVVFVRRRLKFAEKLKIKHFGPTYAFAEVSTVPK